jgi:hypothetical protein
LIVNKNALHALNLQGDQLISFGKALLVLHRVIIEDIGQLFCHLVNLPEMLTDLDWQCFLLGSILKNVPRKIGQSLSHINKNF